MATYTVNISGSLSSSYGYATLDGTKNTTTGTKTYTSKPTVAVYVSSSRSTLRSSCKVTLNGTTVKSGHGSYTADIGDADTVNIKFNAVASGSYTYYTCDITTEKTSSGGGGAASGDHNANVNGVSYEIEGGTARLNGVGYEIDNGMTKVGGVAYEIAFYKPPMYTVSISGNVDETYCYVEINGTKYKGTQTLEFEEGTVITTYCNQKLTHTVNQVEVGGKTYSFNLTANTTISMSLSSNGRYGILSIKY